MQLIATDTLHITSVQPEPLRAGERFDLNEGDAKSLIDRGLAKPARSAPAPAAKVAPPAKDKVAPTPQNKSAG